MTHRPLWFPPLARADFDRRIVELREIARDEGLPFSEASLVHAREFLFPSGRVIRSRHWGMRFAAMLRTTCRPSVFLVGNGNIRLVWDWDDQRFGCQFREDGSTQTVMLDEGKPASA